MTLRSLLLISILVFLSKANIAQSVLGENNSLLKLKNGLSILIIEDSSIPIVHFDIAFRYGAKSEDLTTNGLAHLYEHMMFTATKSYPSTQQFQNEISKLGIVTNALTNEESVHYYFSLVSDNWEPGLDLFAEGVINPLFIDGELKLQKSAIKDELNIFASDPYYLLSQASKRALWGSQYTRKDISGNIKMILQASKNHLHEIQAKHHTPNQALLIIAGNIKKDEVITKVKTLFGRWSITGSNAIPTDNYQFSNLKTNKYVLLENSQVESPGLLVEWQGPGSNVDDQIAASLFLYLINLNSSAFHIDLNEKDYVYDYFAGIRYGSKSSTLFMEFYPDAKTTDDLIKWLDKQIESWSENGALTGEALALAKRKWNIESVFEQEKLSEYILDLADRWAIGDLALSTELQSRIQKVTLEDINRVVNDFLNQPRAYGLVIKPKETKNLHKSIRNKFLPE